MRYRRLNILILCLLAAGVSLTLAVSSWIGRRTAERAPVPEPNAVIGTMSPVSGDGFAETIDASGVRFGEEEEARPEDYGPGVSE